ncbi:MAG: glutathione peroxidase [Candidatus Margulisiibacteriota bacterium]
MTEKSLAQSNKIYQFEMKTIDGESFDFENLKNKVVLIVNVASKCGFTGQYKGLQKIYQKFKDKGFIIIGIPSNSFGNQEPGTAEEIKSFCELNYNVSFPILEKSSVNGENAIPLYQFLTDKKLHPKTGGKISWNFNKFLVDNNGYVIERFSSFTKPESVKIVNAIQMALENE